MTRLRDDAGRIIRGGVLVLVAGIVALLLAITLGLMAVFGIGWFQRGTADFRGKVAATNQVRANGAYRIAAYNHFYDLCAGIQTDEVRITNAERDLKMTKDPARQLQLEANLTAAENTRAGDINQYNADARKTDTLAHFRASDLPYQIDPKEHTTCKA